MYSIKPINFTKFVHLCINNNPNVIFKRTMLTSVRRGASSMELAKETFIRFCDHFNNVPVHDLTNDPVIIKFFTETIDKNNYLCNRAFQLALDVTYSKRNFDRIHVLSNFEKYFSIKNSIDPYDTTSTIDQSTLFTTLQSKIVKEKHPNWEIFVNQTPPSNVSIRDLPEKLRNTLEQNKALTENRFPDIHINGIPYDYKFTKEPVNLKNHIYLMPESSKAFADFIKHIKHLVHQIQYERNLPIEFQNKVLVKLKTIQQNFPEASPSVKHEIINDWNNLSIKIADQRPANFGSSMFIITHKSYVPDTSLSEETKKISLTEGHLDQVKTKIALSNMIDNYPTALKESIYEATKGALGHVLGKEVDQ